MCVCDGRNAWEKGKKTEVEQENKNRKYKKCGYLPESPTGAEYVVPPVSLDEGPESGESE